MYYVSNKEACFKVQPLAATARLEGLKYFEFSPYVL